MREIKFRGRSEKNSEWLVGSLVCFGNFKCIWPFDADFYDLVQRGRRLSPEYIIDPATVGQYIGLKDANDLEIYEGDSILVHQFLFEGVEVEKEFKGNVVWIEEAACFGVKVTEQMDNLFLNHTGYETLEEMEPFCFSSLYGLHEESFKVIGNIHTNE